LPARASFSRTYDFTTGKPSAQIRVTNPDTVSWHIQFNQAGIRLLSNQVYTVSFWAKSFPATDAEAAIMRAHTDYAVLGYSRGLSLSTNWQQFTATFQGPVTENNARVNFGGMGDKLATFWFADVQFRRGGQLGEFPAGASLASRTVPNVIYQGSGYTGTRSARRDWLAFLRDLEVEYYSAMVSYIRTDLGYEGLIFGTVMANSPATVQSRLNVIDSHAYWQHPQFPGQQWDPVNWVVPNVSIVNSLSDDVSLAWLSRQRIKDKPFTVTEYQHSSPAYYGGEGPLLLAAYGAFQDWDGIWMFDYGPGSDATSMGYVRSYFDTDQHPTKMVNILLAANLFRRGDVRPAQHEVTAAMTTGRELEALLNTYPWGIFNSSQLGVPGLLAFTNRLSTLVTDNPPALPPVPPAPSTKIITSDTGELQWNASVTASGRVTIDSAKTKALIGFTDEQTFDFEGVALRPGKTRLGWSTLAATLVRGESFTNDCTFLVIATGWWENTGQVWKDASKNSVGNQWGRAPVLAEPVPFSITLSVATNRVRAWVLNERGQRSAPVSLNGSSLSTSLIIDTNSNSLWYEVEVSPAETGFQQWRNRYFTGPALLDPAISGPSAAPDGDGVANLWKYYLGLPAGAQAPGDRLPTPSLVETQGNSFLGITFLRDKSAADVILDAEVSSDLLSWAGDCCVAETFASADDTLESVVVRDAAPIGDMARRYLRLRLQERSP
jgi:hypothetical protein